MSKKASKKAQPSPQAAASKGMEKLCVQLGLKDLEAEAFLCALREGVSSRSALVLSPRAPEGYHPPFPCLDTSDESWSWLPPRCFVPTDTEAKPSSYEDYKQGFYYLLDLSSCWESAPLVDIPPPSQTLDLCAAPGGKSMLALARFRNGMPHISNEVHAGRRGILRENMKLCGHEHVEITGLRPDQWKQQEDKYFDLIIADAPCSGQSLLAKGIKNPGCLGAAMVNGNAKRQKGILLSILPRVAKGGYLLYTTCTYTPEENEKVMAYLLKRHPEFEAVDVANLERFRSSLSSFPSYRLLPAHGYGAGGFCCLLRKKSS